MILEKSKINLYIIIIFLLLFIGQIFFISPIGEFALNDDWAHTLSIDNFVNQSQNFYAPWLSSNMHVPILIGIFLSKLFGFSFSLLRICNLLFSLATIFLFFYFLRKNKLSATISFLITLLLWFNPLFFNLSYTFMGDILALFLLLMAIIFYWQGFAKLNYWLILCGSLISVVGFFTRQTAVILMLAVFIYYVTDKKLKKIHILWTFILPGIILTALYLILNYFNYLPGKVEARFLVEGLSYTKTILFNLWHYFLLLILFTLPIGFSLLMKNLAWLKDKWLWLSIIISTILGLIAFFTGNFFPQMGNIINLQGLGPTTQIMQGQVGVWGNSVIYNIISIILIFALGLNIFIIYKYRGLIFKWQNEGFIWLFLLFYLILIIPINAFDRYLILILPIVFLCRARLLQNLKWSKTTFVIILILMISYSAIGTFNYLQWNKVRWQLGNELLAQNVLANEIDGGYEFNGWYLYQQSLKQPLGNFTPKWAPWYIQELFPGHLMPYIISFSELGGYKVIKKEPLKTIFSQIDYLYLNQVEPGSLK